ARPVKMNTPSATVAVSITVAVSGDVPLSIKLTEGVYEPSSAYVWLPVTLKLLSPLGATVPALVVASPQLIVAAKVSVGVSVLKEATTTEFAATFSISDSGCGVVPVNAGTSRNSRPSIRGWYCLSRRNCSARPSSVAFRIHLRHVDGNIAAHF